MPFNEQNLLIGEKILWPPQEEVAQSPIVITNQRIFSHVSCRVKLHLLQQSEDIGVRCTFYTDQQPPFKSHNRDVLLQRLPVEVGSQIGEYIGWNLHSLTRFSVDLGPKGRFQIKLEFGKHPWITFNLLALPYRKYTEILKAFQTPFDELVEQLRKQLQGQPLTMAGVVISTLGKRIKQGENIFHFSVRTLLVLAAVFGAFFSWFSFKMPPNLAKWILMACFFESIIMIYWAVCSPRAWLQKIIVPTGWKRKSSN